MINLHGLNINTDDLNKVSSETRNFKRNSGAYTEVFYDRGTGEVWSVGQISLGHNSWTEYRDDNIIKVCDTPHHMSAQALADAIAEAVAEDDWEKSLPDPYSDDDHMA